MPNPASQLWFGVTEGFAWQAGTDAQCQLHIFHLFQPCGRRRSNEIRLQSKCLAWMSHGLNRSRVIPPTTAISLSPLARRRLKYKVTMESHAHTFLHTAPPPLDCTISRPSALPLRRAPPAAKHTRSSPRSLRAPKTTTMTRPHYGSPALPTQPRVDPTSLTATATAC